MRRIAAVGTVGAAAVIALVTPPALGQPGTPDPPLPRPGGAGGLQLPQALPQATGDRPKSIEWRRCGNVDLQLSRARCGTLRVPLDYDQPGGRQISIAVSRVRHTVSHRRYQGVILVNPGGPGGSGLGMSGIGSAFPRRVSGAYDWIGFDPRGVGSSRPKLVCSMQYFGFDRPGYLPRPRANQRAWLDRSKRYARSCRGNGALLDNVTTVDTARDMDMLRVALGAPRINYLGFSYGTYLGQVYATLFPDHVRRMVLDSNIDPRNVFYRSNLRQSRAFQPVFEAWFRWIGRYDSVFRLGDSQAAVQRRFNAVQRRLARHPAGGRIGPSEWIDLYQPAAYTQSEWPRLARVFSRYVHKGRVRGLVRSYRQARPSDNTFAGYLAVQCTDAPWPRRWRIWSRDTWAVHRRAPMMAWPNTWFNSPCRSWPAPSTARFQVVGRLSRGPLLVGGTLDAATPFRNSLVVRSIFRRSRLVAIKGETSHGVGPDVRCSRKRISAYLLRGDLPKRRSGRRADVVCPAPPQPGPHE